MEKARNPRPKSVLAKDSQKSEQNFGGMKCAGTVFLSPRLWYNLWDFYCGTMRSKGARYMQHRFFALISRMRYISRWGLMRNTFEENVQEHSHMVAVLAHGLAMIQRDILKSPPTRSAAPRRRCFTMPRRFSPGISPRPSSTIIPISARPIRPWRPCRRRSF